MFLLEGIFVWSQWNVLKHVIPSQEVRGVAQRMMNQLIKTVIKSQNFFQIRNNPNKLI